MSSYLFNLRSKVGRELLLVPGVAAVIRNAEGQLLLQEKADGSWSLPAGAIEPGESPMQAICREVLEETGLVVEPTQIRGVYGGIDFRYTYPNGDVVEYTVVLFRCRIIEKSAAPLDVETRSLCYFTQKDMPALALPYPMDALFGAD